MKIYGWLAGIDGTSHYRVVLPLMTIAAQNPDITVDMGARLPPEELTDDHSDIIVGQRICKPLVGGLWEKLGEEGRTLVFESDDDLQNIRADNPAFTAEGSNWPGIDVWRDEWMVAMVQAMSVANLVTTTNEHLAERFRQHSDNVVVLPNYVDEALLTNDPPVRTSGETLRVGYTCSPTHDKDIIQASPDISNGLRKTDAELVIIGTDYRKFFTHKRAVFRPWSNDVGVYYNNICDLHIGLAPLAHDLFNMSKSPLKAAEYGALGIPVLADDVGPYHDYVIHGETGYLIKRPGDWTRYIRMLENDEDMRYEMGVKAQARASELTIQKNAWRWLDAYKGAMK